MKFYKLTDQEMQTHGNFQWELGKWYEIPEENQGNDLCSESWFHCYNDPYLAILLNPIHANIENPRLFEIEVDGDSMEDKGLKFGFTKMRLVKEIKIPEVSMEQRVEFAIRCALEVCHDKKFVSWANKWLSGEDRSPETAYVTYVTYYALSYVSDASDAAAYFVTYAAIHVLTCVSYYVACSISNAASASYYVASNHANFDLIEIVNKVFGKNNG